MARVLIVDDEANLRKVLRALLSRAGHQVVAVADVEAALQTLQGAVFDLVITDLKMPGQDGLALLEMLRRDYPELPVILMTAHGTVDTAVSALKMGAFDYITKPFDQHELRLAVRKAAAVGGQGRERLQDAGDPQGRFHIIGQSPRMRDIYAIIEKIAATPSTVLITGESGTGKELVAAALHDNSQRAPGPFIKVNCGAVPQDLMESEFFGYEQGAFTGAVSSKPGRFELADGGTLFLDEIGEISTAMQVKLLRALQDGEFERVGGVRTIKVDVRIVAATNRDIQHDVSSGAFRDDLYYRLNVVPIVLPALRDRREDIASLAQHMLRKFNKRLHKDLRGISPEALCVLQQYAWPGNIRELENVIERTLLFCEPPSIEAHDLPEELRRPSRPGEPPAEAGSSSFKDIVRQATSSIERDLIVRALDETGGNVTHAANLLKISRKGLQNKMKEFNLRDAEV